MPGDFIAGARYLVAGYRLIWVRGVRGYALIPMIINALVFTALVWWAISGFGGMLDRFLPAGGTAWWATTMRALAWVLFSIAAGTTVFFTYSVVANLVGAVFNGNLAAAVERHLTGAATGETSGLAGTIREILPMLGNELRKLMYSLLWLIPAGLVFLIPLVNLAAPLLWMALMAWLLALEYLDYPMGNHGHRFVAVRAFLRGRRPLGLGFGAAVVLSALVPGLNLILMPAAVAGATAFWLGENRAADT